MQVEAQPLRLWLLFKQVLLEEVGQVLGFGFKNLLNLDTIFINLERRHLANICGLGRVVVLIDIDARKVDVLVALLGGIPIATH